MFPEEQFTVQTIQPESGVDQPRSDPETYEGALNRAEAGMTAVPLADYWVGIEGGIEETDLGMAAFAWISVLSSGGEGRGKTAAFFLPERVAALVRDGMELGHADDLIFGHTASKRKKGAVGLLTENAVDRTALYEQGVIMALIPFKNPKLYPDRT